MSMIINGILDCPLPGGLPKAVELFVTADIADLSNFGVGSANNGGAFSTTFNLDDWTFFWGRNALDNEASNATAARPFPVQSHGVTPLNTPAANTVINEIDADQTSTDIAEFIELYDGGTGGTSLDGISVIR